MHRDIKLENVMITLDKKIKIIDFAYVTKSPTCNRMVGTPISMPPEIIKNKNKYG